MIEKFAKLQFVNEKQICVNREKNSCEGVKRKSSKTKKNKNGSQRCTYVRQNRKYGNANLNKR